MSMLDYFQDWETDSNKIAVVLAPDADGNWLPTETTGDLLSGVKYNRSSAERFFSQSWAADITDVFVTDSIGSLTKDSKLLIEGVKWSIDSIVDEGNIGEVFTIGLKVIA